MFSQPFRQFGRCLLAASAVSLSAAGLGAQATPAAPAPPAGPNPSRVDIFAGYSYFGPHGYVRPQNTQYNAVNIGAIGSGALYFNKYVGMEVSFAAHPDGKNDAFYIASAGPIVRAPMEGFTLFGHAMAGGARTTGPNYADANFYHNEPATWGPSLTAGGGMDYDLPFFNHALGLRLFQADFVYIHSNFGPYNGLTSSGFAGGRANINAVQLSSGLIMHFGHIVPPPPVTYSCVVSPTSAYAGDPITVTGTAMNLNPKKTASYSWSGDAGVKITGTSNVANVDTNGMNAGTYNVKGTVTEGKKAGEFADCAAQFTIMPPQPPTITCSASPSTVAPGGTSTITSVGNSAQNRPLTYSYSTTAGTVDGTGTTATLSTTGAAPGTITVTCNVTDDKGQTASATTTVSVNAPPPPPRPTTSSLRSISFDRDTKRPARVDNEAKACLDDIALNLQRSSDAKVILVGNSAAAGRHPEHLAAERAVNTKAYLVTEKGIDASRVTVYTGTTDANTVTSTLVPAGATAPSAGTAVDENSVKPVSRTAPARRRHRR